MRIWRFPFPIQVHAVNLSAAMRPSVIRAESSRNPGDQCLLVGQIKRRSQARHENQIAWPAQSSIQCCPTMKTVDSRTVILAGIAEAECRSALSVQNAERR